MPRFVLRARPAVGIGFHFVDYGESTPERIRTNVLFLNPALLAEGTDRAMAEHIADIRPPVSVEDIASRETIAGFIEARMGEVAIQVVGNVAVETLESTYPHTDTLDLQAIDIHGPTPASAIRWHSQWAKRSAATGWRRQEARQRRSPRD